MKSIFSSRHNKSPHNNEKMDKQEAPFFGKQGRTPFFNTSRGGMVQTKLTVGKPGDKYEKEADNMADAVVNTTSKPDIHNKEISSIQRESLATPQEDEKLGTAEQRMEEDKLVQEKPELQRMNGEEEEGMLNKMEGEEEGMLNKMEGEEEEEGMVSKMEGEEEEESLQTKSNGSTKTAASSGVARQIKSKSGKGKTLPKNTQAEMKSSFGTDFSGVNIHTDQDAVNMNKELGAQAFTHGSDVYFNSGKYNPDSSEGKHLLAHELTHVVQQNSLSIQKKEKKPGAAGKNCSKQEDSDILPGGVGLIEIINREALLDQILGKERASFIEQIKKERDARKFVCEAGISAVMALYYNRDYRNRIRVEKAREAFSVYPQYYSSKGFDQKKQTKEMLEKKYDISIERGDKDWSPRDLVLLSEALGTMTEREIPLLGKYHFIRWTNRCNQKNASNPEYECTMEDYGLCGLHEAEIVHRKYTITMYDCMNSDSEDDMKKGYGVQPGADVIIHEIGHAMEYGKLRLAMEKASDAKKEVARIEKQLQKTSKTDDILAIKNKLKSAKIKMDDTNKVMEDTVSNSTIAKFQKLTKGKKALTDYSKTNAKEAFADAYMLFKVAPKKLKRKNKKLFKWFDQGGYV
ncbi:DUF4157 domain-containing protein [Pricia sp.]|uniref:eCIS core domain-containing protein n=1 Tax=Pricia sp. TaxID=2268138 RepID=UPI0035937F23